LATTVKIDDEAKDQLKRLQAHLSSFGVKVSQQELLAKIINFAAERSDQLLQTFGHALPPLEEDPAWIRLHNPRRWGVTDASITVDRYLYGE